MIDCNMENDRRYKVHQQFMNNYLNEIDKYGYWGIYSFSIPGAKISKERIEETLLSKSYSEAVNLASRTITHQSGYTKPYEINRQSLGKKPTILTTCYFDGLIVSDGYLDFFCEEDDGLNPSWLTYKIQRHLQLSKEVYEGLIEEFKLMIVFKNLGRYKWELYMGGHIDEKKSFSGYHKNICRKVVVSEIHGRDEWNKVMEIVVDCMVEVARIFDFGSLPQPQYYWSKDGELSYSSGISNR